MEIGDLVTRKQDKIEIIYEIIAIHPALVSNTGDGTAHVIDANETGYRFYLSDLVPWVDKTK